MTGKALQSPRRAATRGTDRLVGKDRQTRRRFFQPLRALHGLVPRGKKVAEFLSSLTGRDKRSSERQLAGGAIMSGDDFVKLLHSDFGFEFLEAAMGDARPEWWVRMSGECRIASLRREMERVERDMELAGKPLRAR